MVLKSQMLLFVLLEHVLEEYKQEIENLLTLRTKCKRLRQPIHTFE